MSSRLRPSLLGRPWLTASVVVVIVALVGASVALAVVRTQPSSAAASARTTAHHVEHISLLSSSPASGTTNLEPDSQFTLQFSSPLAGDSSDPSFNPPVSGTWVEVSPSSLTFEPSTSLPPGRTITLSIPGGQDGVRGANGAHLDQSLTETFAVAPMSVLRLQQLLAQLNYLPLTFSPTTTAAVPPVQLALPQAGTFSWRWSTLPANFQSLWTPAEPDVITSGAVMMFESENNLATDGVAGPMVWSALLADAASGETNTNPNYDFVEVATTIPEHVDVWRNGAVAYSTLANTGIEAAPTEVGTWPVYARYVTTTMSGTNPDGSHYSDPGVPWVSYFHGGDALHGFIRSSYGVPQSLGCVEMPPANAQVVFPYTPIGTLVTINPN